jgi:hypothetical protein
MVTTCNFVRLGVHCYRHKLIVLVVLMPVLVVLMPVLVVLMPVLVVLVLLLRSFHSFLSS